MVQVGMTHQAVADHFNVSRIAIPRLMIRLRQTGRTNDRPRNGKPRLTLQHQDVHLLLIHLQNRMITAADTARRTPILANVRISSRTVRRRLRESVLRARCPEVGPILNHRHRTARLAWARSRRRWGFYTWQHIFFSDESRFSLRISYGRYRVYRRRGKHFTDQCVYTSPTVLEAEELWCGAGICHDGRTQETLNAVKYRDDILDPIVLPYLRQLLST